ncbi:MAG: Dabb family protein [Acidimicrobiales bacterium]
MIRHLVAFSFKESASDADRKALIAELAELPHHYPTMQRFAIGPNISQRDDTFSHAFSVEFESEAQLVAYLDSERHETFVTERFRPLTERRVIVSFED